MTRKTLVLTTAAAMALNSGVAFAEVTGNIGAASNYIWRGVTQTMDQAAISGGVDYAHDSGFYAGTWVSNVDFGGNGGDYEHDVYLGFGGEAGGLGYDVGVITYMYPVNPNTNFTEVYVSGSYGVVSLGVNLTVDNAEGNTGGMFVEDDMYVSLSADVTDNVSVYAGSYMFENDSPANDFDYNHYGVSLAMGDFAFSLDKNDIDASPADDNFRATVSWGKGFEL